MDAEDYTPDDQQVEDTYVSGVLEFISKDNEAKVREQFHRWLEAHDDAVTQSVRTEHLTLFDERCVYCGSNPLDVDECPVTGRVERRMQFHDSIAQRDLEKLEQGWDEGAFTLSGEHPMVIEKIIRPAIRQANPYRTVKRRQDG